MSAPPKKVILASVGFLASVLLARELVTEAAIRDEGQPRSIEAPGGRMIAIPAGEFHMGVEHPQMLDARPVHRVHVDAFFVDETEVTNEAFLRFVEETGYVTVAERAPRAADFPGVAEENLVAGSMIFAPPRGLAGLGDHTTWWTYVPGASFRHPEGPRSNLIGRGDHPVVHVAYDDAARFCAWAGKRLPTEAEWEWAARGGLDGKPFAWGDLLRPQGKPMANTFQGNFPSTNTQEDGYETTAPVRSFPPNTFGLYDVAGNVWEWVADWYRDDHYATRAASTATVRNPPGPESSFDSREPGAPKRVQKGGSFLCTEQYCTRYMPGGRGKATPDSATNHVGFRCARDASP